jgi:hypothetical protein
VYARALACLLLPLCPPPLVSQAFPPLAVTTEVSVGSIVEHTPFTIKVTVDHPDPAEVVLTPPPFEGAFVQDTVTTEGAFRQHRGGPEAGELVRVTVVTFTFIPVKSGALTLGAFTAAAAGRSGATWPLHLIVQPDPGTLRPHLLWRAPSQLRIGEEAEIQLRLLNWEQVKNYGENAPFFIETAENAIIDRLPDAARGGDAVLRLRVIALSGSELVLRGQSRYNGGAFPLPALHLPLVEAAELALAAAVSPPVNGEEAAGGGLAVPLRPAAPSMAARVWEAAAARKMLLFKERRLAALAAARELWDAGATAGALRLLRRGERDALFGPSLRAPRAALEAVCGFQGAPDEVWRPAAALFCGVAAALGAAGVALLCAARRPAAARRALHGCIPPLAALAALLGTLCLFQAFSGFAPKTEAVLLDTPVFSIPEAASAVPLPAAVEGQYTRVHARADGFLYIQSPHGGAAGWIPEENALLF